MKRTMSCILVLALAVGAAGCVQMHSETTINDDGSGTATLAIGISQSMLEAIKEMQELDPDASGDMEMPAFDEIQRDRIEKAIKPYDVKLTEFEKSDADGRESIRLAFAFKDLKGLSAVMAATLGEDPEDGMGIYETGDGNYVLKQARYDFSDMPLPEQEEEAEAPASEEADPAAEQTPEQMQRQMELVGKMMASMSELDISVRITVPGDIIETNAPQQEGRTSIWTINSSNMMTAGEDMDPVITFSGKGVKIKNALKE